MSKTVIVVSLATLVIGSMLQQANSGTPWADIFIHGASRQWLAVVILLAILLTVADLGGGVIAGWLAILIAGGYLIGAAGWLGPAIQGVIQAEWGIKEPGSSGALPGTGGHGA